jgi:hypothetical protein
MLERIQSALLLLIETVSYGASGDLVSLQNSAIL